jgi:hypothetical protein
LYYIISGLELGIRKDTVSFSHEIEKGA